MAEKALLIARKIDHGRMEVHIDAYGAPITHRKDFATNFVLTVLMRNCGITKPDEFDKFLRALHKRETAVLACDDLDGVAAELGLVLRGG
jgi:hypothetical protein